MEGIEGYAIVLIICALVGVVVKLLPREGKRYE